ncbi:hypothetical protein AB0B45_22260 [Nonomuraea sp. NPDC049152]|uniref:hypothetical protein n=1 Tax=Nonomuraea sp. NPDC049152 TaxID=3154350 RepID=UPI0033C827CA
MTHRDPETPRVIYITDEIQAAMAQHVPVNGDLRALVALLLDKGRVALADGKQPLPLKVGDSTAWLELLDINPDAENCQACLFADGLWPRWPHGSCPYHYGINQALAATDINEDGQLDWPDEPSRSIPSTTQGATPPAKKSAAPCHPATCEGTEVTSS